MSNHIFAYTKEIIGKNKEQVQRKDPETKQLLFTKNGDPQMVDKWTFAKNKFINYPKRVPGIINENGTIGLLDELTNRDEIIKIIAIRGYCTSYVRKDDSLKKNRSSGSNTLGGCMTMLDFDNTCDIQAVQQSVWWDKSYFAYSTSSYGVIQEPLDDNDSLPDGQAEAINKVVGLPKRNFRLVFRFNRFLTVEEILEVQQGLMAIFPMADQTCGDDARVFFGQPKALVWKPEKEYLLTDVDIEFIKQTGAEFLPKKKLNEKARSERIAAKAIAYGGELTGNSNIYLSNGDIVTVAEVLSDMPLGWKQQCFSPFRDENNPSAFIKKQEHDGSVFIFDSGARLKKTFRAEVVGIKGLQLVRRNKPKHIFEEAEIVEIETQKTGPLYVSDYQDCMTPDERKFQLTKITKSLRPRNLFLAPEGFGKSYITRSLSAQQKKILFCCTSNEQAEKKAEEFRQFKKGEGYVCFKLPIVQCVLSKDYLFKKATGLKLVMNAGADPFGTPTVDKEASIEYIAEQKKCSMKEAEEIWNTEYEPIQVERPKYSEYDIICTTIARAEGMAKSFQERFALEQKSPERPKIISYEKSDRTIPTENDSFDDDTFNPDEWVVIYDDPEARQVCNLIYITEAQEKKIHDHNMKIYEHNLKHPHDIQDPFIPKKFSVGTHHYYVRPKDKKLGMNFKVSDTKYVPIIYTTTEDLTSFLIENLEPETVNVIDLMHDTETDNVTIWGSRMVHKQNDGLIILTVDLLKLDYPERDIKLIADGLGQPLNHVTNKGRNDLSESDIIIELSQLHPDEALKAQHEITFVLGPKHPFTGPVIQGIILRDKMHQAIGRSKGYREKGDYQTIVICDPHYFEGLLTTSRYKPAPWSGQLDVGKGESIRNKVNIKQRMNEIKNYQNIMNSFVRDVQQYLINNNLILDHPKFEETVRRAAHAKDVIKKRVGEAVKTQLDKNLERTAMLSELYELFKPKPK